MSEEAVPAAKATRKRASKAAAEGEPTPVPVEQSEVARATSATAQPPKLAYLDRYEVVEIHRTQAKNAKYNPRLINDAARRKLKDGIEKIGNLAPLIWNKRTGNIVGGHQRISIFDTVYETKNYKLRVSAVDLDDKQEREANILLNNPQAMGDFDFEKLGEMFKGDIDFAACGFDSSDVFKLFGEDVFGARADGGEKLLKLGDELAENQQRIKREVEQMSAKRDDTQFFLVFVFRDTAELDGVLGRFDLPNEQWQSGDELAARLEKAALWDELQAKKKGTRRKASVLEAEDDEEDAPAQAMADDEEGDE